MATAFKVSMTVRNKAGQIRNIPLTVSDVAGAFWLFPSGANEMVLSKLDSWIMDIICTGAGGTDTTQNEVFIGGMNTGIVVMGHANLASSINRQVAMSPIFVPGGQLVKFVQAA